MRHWWAVCVLLSSTACSEEEPNARTTGSARGGRASVERDGGAGAVGGLEGEADARVEASEPGPTPERVTIVGDIGEYSLQRATDAGTRVPRPAVVGATVCILDRPSVPCVETDERGIYILEGVPEGELTIAIEAAGYVSTLLPVGRFTTANVDIVRDAIARNIADAVGAIYPDPNGGFVSFDIRTGGDGGGSDTLPGLTASMTPASYRGPFYFPRDELPDPALSEMPPSGVLGLFLEVAPGDHVVTLTHPSATTCETRLGWPGATPNEVRVPVLAGYHTVVVGGCY